ncbi:hypothetical protein [Dethiobacter alkaliphilus]|uniref:hypothetical protein n=1 Tax=Dethiobacter alkaliphilus TaxID=427926 RepID=UPI0022279D31|nr:hypothetical protein [Dethiobacter alkaliphilus]MCW3489051.1 hypothetical protein [Dethiobacter alkaliphilus]
MKLALTLLILTCLLVIAAKPAEAHQPRLVTEDTVTVKKPEVSQAFYGTLQGRPAEFLIEEQEEFDLFVSILIPDLPDSRRDFMVNVYKTGDDGNALLFGLDGKEHNWEPFFEPFVADNYFQGPEKKDTVPAGVYRIVVSNPDNSGKYVLSVGEEESFTLTETAQTIRRLPAVKRFFEKSPWTAYFNLVGLFMLLSLLFVSAAIYGAYRLGKLLIIKII